MIDIFLWSAFEVSGFAGRYPSLLIDPGLVVTNNLADKVMLAGQMLTSLVLCMGSLSLARVYGTSVRFENRQLRITEWYGRVWRMDIAQTVSVERLARVPIGPFRIGCKTPHPYIAVLKSEGRRVYVYLHKPGDFERLRSVVDSLQV